MLETLLATSTFSIKTEAGSDPLSWECQQFPDSNASIKQEVMDTSFDLNQTDFTELKPLPFDYGPGSTGGGGGLTGPLDPILNNNNNSSNHNNNNSKLADLYINIKPMSPGQFPFHPSPSDVTSSGSMSPQGMTKIDFSTDQNAFDDLANIVGLSVGADSTVPSLEGDVDLEALFENIKPLPLLLPGDGGSVYEVQSSTAESSCGSSSSSSSLSSVLLSNSISNQSLSNTQPYIGSLASLVKGSRMTIVEPRDAFPQNMSPILRGAITGVTAAAIGGGGSSYHLSYPQLKFESMEMIKQEYYQDQMPHSTISDHHHHHSHQQQQQQQQQHQRRLGPDGCLIRSKPKPHKMKQRSLLGSAGSSPTGGNGLGSGNGNVNGLNGNNNNNGDLSKKMMHHCQICNRGFLNKSNIKVHLRTHTGEKPFGCEHCSKAFRQKAHLLKHMSIHKRISRD